MISFKTLRMIMSLGYCGDIFRKTGALYGPIDIAAIPIGAYGVPAEAAFHKPNHMNPRDAVECHCDLGSRRSIGVHWVRLTSPTLLTRHVRLTTHVYPVHVDRETAAKVTVALLYHPLS